MQIKPIVMATKEVVRKNLPTILTVASVVGTVTTAALAAKATPGYIVEKTEEKPEKALGKAKIFMKHYWPAFVSGIASGTCAIMANSINMKGKAAALTALALSETNLKDVKEAAKKVMGEKKLSEVESKVAEEKLRKNPTEGQTIIFTGSGDSLCYDTVSGRYFRSTIEKIRQSVNDLNHMLLLEDRVMLNDLYDLLGLEPIKLGDALGWNMNQMGDILEVNFTSQLSDTGEPCLVMEYDVAPSYFGLDY